MSINQDFSDLFKILNEEEVKYLVVGAYAVTFHAEPRYTKDLDIWIASDQENAQKAWTALTRFGAPMHDITQEDFTNPNLVYQIGIEPNRIDIIMDVSALTFADAWNNRITSKYGENPIYILGLQDLIKAKKTTGRPQDLIDVDNLELVLKQKS